MSLYADVCKFHRKFGLDHPGDGKAPQLLDAETQSFREKFLDEELSELAEAWAERDLPKAADALVDLVYVALGTAALMRLPFDECWVEVQRANMAKERALGADDPRSTRGHRLDVVKPAGWTPPDIAGVLLRSAVSPPDIAGVLLRSAVSRVGRDGKHLRFAQFVAENFSKDPTTKVGAVLVGDDHRQIAFGYNGLPPRIADTPERLMCRETKHKLTRHAEVNALDNATFDTRGSTLYTTLHPCVNCALAIISKGVRRVVCVGVPDHEPWIAEAIQARELLDEAKVVVDIKEGSN